MTPTMIHSMTPTMTPISTVPLAALALLLNDGSAANIFDTPFIVPVAGTLMILGIVVAGIWSGVRTREMQSQERLAAIAKGLPLPPEREPHPFRDAHFAFPAAGTTAARPGDPYKARRAGTVLTSIGIGLIAFFAALALIVRERAVLSGAATGLIPLAIGCGFLIDARLRQRELARLPQPAPEPGTQAPLARPGL